MSIGLLFLLLGFRIMGVVVCALSVLIGLVSFASQRGEKGIAWAVGLIGEWVGRILSAVILVPTYLVGFSLVRIWSWLGGSDPLQVRGTHQGTFWLGCDSESRTLRYMRCMFATELLAGKRRPILTLLVALATLLLVAEMLLQLWGFGNPVLYVRDAQVGYYPAPNQSVRRYGGVVTINQFGMRSANCSRRKAEGTLRILMLGDSTLWGGSYMDDDQTYGRLLNNLLNADKDLGDVEVLCMGVNGWGPFHKLNYVEKFGTFDADIAIVCLPIIDIYRPWRDITSTPYSTVNGPPRCALEEIAVHLLWRYRTSRIGPTPQKQKLLQAEKGVDAYCTLVSHLQDSGCEVFVEVLPSRLAGTTHTVPEKEQQAVDHLRKALQARQFTKLGFPVGLFRDQGEIEDLYHDGVHLHWLGHKVYSDYMYGRLVSESQRLSDWKAMVGHRRVPGSSQ